jgi:hypothetical protein
MLQKATKNDILMRHGVDPVSYPDDRNHLKPNRNQWRALLHAQTVPDSRTTSAGMTAEGDSTKANWPRFAAKWRLGSK